MMPSVAAAVALNVGISRRPDVYIPSDLNLVSISPHRWGKCEAKRCDSHCKSKGRCVLQVVLHEIGVTAR